ncbi:MAG: hypothetical protein AB8B56_05420 [Crocinitomicaceae bacterium]
MTRIQKKSTLSILSVLFVISFFLPVIYSTEDLLLGFYCAVWGAVIFVMHLSSGDILALLLDILLMLPNVLMILTFLSHEKFSPRMKQLFFILATISAGSWIFTYKLYLALEDGTNLHVGYWLWLLSLSGYLLIRAIPSKSESLD